MCDSGTNEKKVRVYKVTRPDYGPTNCVYRDGATLIDAEFAGAEIGEVIHVTLVEATQDQLDNLPEFEGW